MAATALPQPMESWSERDDEPIEDHIVVFHGASWEDYDRLLALRGDHSAPRISFLEGEIEIMSPSFFHESIKGRIGCMVEAWCLERGIEFTTSGSWTLRKKRKQRGVEPDECYVFGVVKAPKRPDLAIEVIWTSGRIDKLEIYRKLDVREVWFWRKGIITPYRLSGEQYEQATESAVLPGIDIAQLASFVQRDTTSQSVREYLAALRGR